MRERTMNLKIYSRALRVRRMGSHCSPRLETSRYRFKTDISFLCDNKDGRRRTNNLKYVLFFLFVFFVMLNSLDNFTK